MSQRIQIQRASHTRPAPILPLQQLDVLWLQITGTRCNIACRHCFISCGPKDTRHAFMTLQQVRETLAVAQRQGVREYYMSGGEPFLHPDLHALVAMTLKQGPLTILTNGILLDEAEATWVRETQRCAVYSFDLRVSLDGSTAALNDSIRGRGTFEKITLGIRRLAEQGVNPIITVTKVYEGIGTAKGRTAFLEFLHRIGLDKPRLKFLAPFLIGREARRNRPYREDEHLEEGDLTPQEYETLQCASGRIVTAEGVYPCPLLINEPGALMARRLEEACRYIFSTLPAIPATSVVSPAEIRRSPVMLEDRCIAVFGGIYNNHLALEAVLRDARQRGATAFYCLGDIGGFGPHPDNIFPLLFEYQVTCSQGNYDHSIGNDLKDCGYTDPRDNYYAQISYDYTAARTSPHYKAWLRDLPTEHRCVFDGKRVLMVHGSPRRVNEFLWESTSPELFLTKLLDDYQADVLLCTHTGIQWMRALPDGRLFVNIGATGYLTSAPYRLLLFSARKFVQGGSALPRALGHYAATGYSVQKSRLG